MYNYNEKELLVKKLKGQRLSIPDMRPIFAHWPRGQNENYEATKETIDKQLAAQPMGEEARKAFANMNPALLAATWWPAASKDRYRILVELIIWFGYWDDLVEGLTPDPNAAEGLRRATKTLVRQSLGLTQPGDEDDAVPSDPLVLNFKTLAAEVCANYDEEQRKSLLGHFDRYIDATRLEAEADLSERLPSLKRYWEVRILTSGMGTLLGFTEYAVEAKLPSQLVASAAYEALWMTTIVINSIVNDLISFKKEMKAGSVLSSVAILYQQVDNLDAAVQMSLAHLRILVNEFDRTANTILSEFPLNPEEVDAVSKVIDALRTVNTGNLEWSLQSKRYGVGQFIRDDGRIELIL
ncbi:terpenoid synthase [Annulohypoxylon truncatum]|uniref:terpenoid synthase n=1 Tax=Annulohypoxylon truncatum TaxID=327061 RepID=UPI00200848B6|nr:terpenoid synthase [Annulohypoxylon truncatum]KAI1206458.1 terpenoid synthase [Annulohypoxylon truncatum]